MPADAPNLTPWPEGATLLLGIGAQKAGTTWLHAYLRTHPDCTSGPMKELHYFDGLDGDRKLGDRLRADALKRARANPGSAIRVSRLERLQAVCAAPDPGHHGYLSVVATPRLTPGKVALDFTPEYALVPDAVFRQMAALPGAKMIFLMREPVARFWSAVRMRAAKTVARDEDFETGARAVLDTMLAQGNTGAHLRSDYVATLDKLQHNVPQDQRLVLFFEDLFAQETLDEVCAFLGIATRPIDQTQPRNEGQKADMRPDQVAALTALLRPQYETVNRLCGGNLPQAWHARFAARANVA
ncbi:MAG: sulfotransferase [Rhodobacter sp.]|nr:sulfotransferase [Paracoccaceae bacterium]MCC0073840.1 sulfotransferase [Rhodobacter sp.]